MLASFDDFIAKYNRTYKRQSSEYDRRFKLYKQSLDDIRAQNEHPDALWVAGVNAFADRSQEELAKLRGRRGPRGGDGGHNPSSIEIFTETGEGAAISTMLSYTEAPESASWMKLRTAKRIKDQGACGSCWALATITVLEAHYEIHMNITNPRSFSAQELVSCVENPKHCGGKGGCDGATVELGMAYALARGLDTESGTPYQATDQPCSHHVMQVLSGGASEAALIAPSTTTPRGASFGLAGWQTLPVNKEEPLVKALMQKGPVAVSIAAKNLHNYHSGVFDKCAKDCVVDHAVTLVGFGSKAKGTRYWHLRNSWSSTWGENGLFRMLRRNDESSHCGIDKDPQKGVGCDDGPSEVTVCGTCGILYDSVVPTFSSNTLRSNASYHRVRSQHDVEVSRAVKNVVARQGQQNTLSKVKVTEKEQEKAQEDKGEGEGGGGGEGEGNTEEKVEGEGEGERGEKEVEEKKSGERGSDDAGKKMLAEVRPGLASPPKRLNAAIVGAKEQEKAQEGEGDSEDDYEDEGKGKGGRGGGGGEGGEGKGKGRREGGGGGEREAETEEKVEEEGERERGEVQRETGEVKEVEEKKSGERGSDDAGKKMLAEVRPGLARPPKRLNEAVVEAIVGAGGVVVSAPTLDHNGMAATVVARHVSAHVVGSGSLLRKEGFHSD
eukprot:TRINITY_DN3920_c0_g1_i1.p1 TRINITY_DN3920_c0_g1~~TRINITY_DN3920_c0_g1_i1.p1  ORF type:complete len:766 (+),score=156.20 TRINITY_DN3920_c0_g1_i1:301-2298(+)